MIILFYIYKELGVPATSSAWSSSVCNVLQKVIAYVLTHSLLFLCQISLTSVQPFSRVKVTNRERHRVTVVSIDTNKLNRSVCS